MALVNGAIWIAGIHIEYPRRLAPVRMSFHRVASTEEFRIYPHAPESSIFVLDRTRLTAIAHADLDGHRHGWVE